MKQYTTAIIGCGRIASEFDSKPLGDIAFSHAGAYSLYPGTRLVAGCDPRPEKRKAFSDKWAPVSVYSDYTDMLKKEKIDILSICTPPETHYPILKDISAFPVKAVYCEKPIAVDTRDAEKMVELCRRKRILLMVNHQRRFAPFYRELRRKISDGLMGKIQQVNCYYTRGILNTGIHLVDLFSFLFGKVEWVEAVRSGNRSPFRDDPNFDATMKFRGGPLLTMKACDDSDYLILEIDILGSKARLRLGNEIEYFKAQRSRNLLNKNMLVRSEKIPFRSAYGAISLEEGVRHIVDCMDKKERPLSPGSSASQALKIIDAMRLSVKDGGKVPIKR